MSEKLLIEGWECEVSDDGVSEASGPDDDYVGARFVRPCPAPQGAPRAVTLTCSCSQDKRPMWAGCPLHDFD